MDQAGSRAAMLGKFQDPLGSGLQAARGLGSGEAQARRHQEDEARRWRDKLLSDQEDSNPVSGVDEEEIQRLLDERGVPTRSEIESLTAQIDLLTKKLETPDEQ